MKRIITYSEREACYKPATDAFQQMPLDDFVEWLRVHHPETVLQPEDADMTDAMEEVCAESERYVLTTTDGMGCIAVNIYEKL